MVSGQLGQREHIVIFHNNSKGHSAQGNRLGVGMKVSAVLAVAGAIVGEFIGSERGLGYLMLQVQVSLDTATMFMSVFLITLLGVILYGAVALLETLLINRGGDA